MSGFLSAEQTARMHVQSLLRNASLAWRQAYDPVTSEVADAVEKRGGLPDVEVRCVRGHGLVQVWVMPDGRAVLRFRMAGVSPGWQRDLSTYFDPGSARVAVSAGVKRSPRDYSGRLIVPTGTELDNGDRTPPSMGFVWDLAQPPQEGDLAFYGASCRCAQRWPFWFSAAKLRRLLADPERPRVVVLPIPESCDCEDCRAEQRHAAQP